MFECGYCGHLIVGESVSSIEVGAVVFGDGDSEREMVPEHKASFCCSGCAWAYGVASHNLYDMSGKELRIHLINEHGLEHPPGHPAGRMSVVCSNYFIDVADAFSKFKYGRN
jgi:hypothetical protein